MPHDSSPNWTDPDVCFAWLTQIMQRSEIAEEIGVTVRTMQDWYKAPDDPTETTPRPNPESAIRLLFLAAHVRGRLTGAEAAAYHEFRGEFLPAVVAMPALALPADEVVVPPIGAHQDQRQPLRPAVLDEDDIDPELEATLATADPAAVAATERKLAELREARQQAAVPDDETIARRRRLRPGRE